VVLLVVPFLIVSFGVIIIAILFDVISMPIIFIIRGEWSLGDVSEWVLQHIGSLIYYLRERRLL
jgi:hypothetical protein